MNEKYTQKKEFRKVKSSVSRRKFLRSTAVGTGLIVGATGTAAAEGEENDLYFNMQSSQDSSDPDDVYTISVIWEWTYDDWNDDNADPNDGVGIHFDTRQWDIYVPDERTDEHCGWDGQKKHGEDEKGVAWRYDQQQEHNDDGEGDFRKCSVKLRKLDGWSSYYVQGEYHHTWNAPRIKGLSLGAGGFAIEWDEEGESWDKVISYDNVG